MQIFFSLSPAPHFKEAECILSFDKREKNISNLGIHNTEHRETRDRILRQKLLSQLHPVKENVKVVTGQPLSLYFCLCVYVSVTGSYFRTFRF